MGTVYLTGWYSFALDSRCRRWVWTYLRKGLRRSLRQGGRQWRPGRPRGLAAGSCLGFGVASRTFFAPSDPGCWMRRSFTGSTTPLILSSGVPRRISSGGACLGGVVPWVVCYQGGGVRRGTRPRAGRRGPAGGELPFSILSPFLLLPSLFFHPRIHDRVLILGSGFALGGGGGGGGGDPGGVGRGGGEGGGVCAAPLTLLFFSFYSWHSPIPFGRSEHGDVCCRRHCDCSPSRTC